MPIKPPPNGSASSWIRWIASIVITVALPAMLIWVIAIERRLTRIESNRFTSEDGLELVKMMEDKADKDNVPPPEVQQRLQRIEEDIKELKADMRELLKRRP